MPNDGDRSVLDVGRDRFGVRFDEYLEGVGRIFLQLRDALVEADPTTYGDLRQEAIGVSLDPGYYGVSIRIPFRGSFINPLTTDLSGTTSEAATAILLTMQHELAHFRKRSHGADFVSEMQRIINLVENKSSVDMQAIKRDLADHVAYHIDIFSYFHNEFQNANIKPRAKSFEDASYQSRGDEGGAKPAKGAGAAGRGQRGVSGEAGAGAAPAPKVQVPAGVSAQGPAVGPVDKRTAEQIEKEVNKALDNFERSRTVTDIEIGRAHV